MCRMGQKQSLNDTLRQYICNRDAEGLAEFLRIHEAEVYSSYLDDKIFVELIEHQWDSKTIFYFAKLANDHQLALLISTAVLRDHVVSLEPIFDLMRDSKRAIEEHQLKHLFITACERENVGAVTAFILNKCHDPFDVSSVRAVVRSQLDKRVVLEKLLNAVLRASKVPKETVQSILDEYLKDAKNEKVKEIVDAYLLRQ